MSMEKIIGIIGAMDIEVTLLKSILAPLPQEKAVKTTEAGSCVFFEGILNGTHVVIVQSGVGKVNAALCAQRLILQFGVTYIINTGIAGAMAHGLKVQDVVVSTDALYHDVNAVDFGYKITEVPGMKCSDFPASAKLIEAAQKAFESLEESKRHSLVKGRIATGDQFIASREQKEKIVSDFGGLCCEMEGGAIAQVCYLNNTPFVIIRAISDKADDSEEMSYELFKEKAAARCAAIVRYMITH